MNQIDNPPIALDLYNNIKLLDNYKFSGLITNQEYYEETERLIEIYNIKQKHYYRIMKNNYLIKSL